MRMLYFIIVILVRYFTYYQATRFTTRQLKVNGKSSNNVCNSELIFTVLCQIKDKYDNQNGISTHAVKEFHLLAHNRV